MPFFNANCRLGLLPWQLSTSSVYYSCVPVGLVREVPGWGVRWPGAC